MDKPKSYIPKPSRKEYPTPVIRMRTQMERALIVGHDEEKQPLSLQDFYADVNDEEKCVPARNALINYVDAVSKQRGMAKARGMLIETMSALVKEYGNPLYQFDGNGIANGVDESFQQLLEYYMESAKEQAAKTLQR